jgi:hypothetical protein
VQVLSLQPIEERSSSGLGSRAFNPLTGVRIPYALPVLYVFDIKHTVPAHERNSRAGRGFYGLLAQRQSSVFTRRMSAVQSRHGPPFFTGFGMPGLLLQAI